MQQRISTEHLCNCPCKSLKRHIVFALSDRSGTLAETPMRVLVSDDCNFIIIQGKWSINPVSTPRRNPTSCGFLPRFHHKLPPECTFRCLVWYLKMPLLKGPGFRTIPASEAAAAVDAGTDRVATARILSPSRCSLRASARGGPFAGIRMQFLRLYGKIQSVPATRNPNPFPWLETPVVKRKIAFLRAFVKTGSVAGSASRAGIDRTTHYEWLTRDPHYRAAFHTIFTFWQDTVKHDLYVSGRVGVFRPLFYKGKVCCAARQRTLCKLADGTSAFADELPGGAVVLERRTVITHDGEMLGRYKINQRALVRLAAVWMPERYGNVLKRKGRSSNR
jgi:hypothetical protein